LFKEWFVHLRYPGHEHDKIVQGVPEGWKRTLLGDVAITNVESFSVRSLPSEINYIDISSVQSGRILQKTRMTAEDAPGRARRRVRDGDVIWSNVRPNLRQFALIIEPEEVDVVSTGFTTITPKEVPSSFLYVAVTTDAFVAHLVNHTTGASYPAVRPDDFERAKLLVPPQTLLNEFHSQCDPMFRLAHRLDAQNRKLARDRDLLLPRFMESTISI
jgi:type I restriction enzyme S subunit